MREARHFTLSARSLPLSHAHSLPSLNPREASTLASSGTEHSPRPFFSARRSHSELTAGRPKRLSRRERAALERRLSDAATHAWLRTHSTVALPRYEMPKSKKRALRDHGAWVLRDDWRDAPSATGGFHAWLATLAANAPPPR